MDYSISYKSNVVRLYT